MKSVVYLEGESSSPIYRRACGITVSGLCGVWSGTKKDTCSMIPARRHTPVLHGADKLACSFEFVFLRRRIIVHMYPCEWSRTNQNQFYIINFKNNFCHGKTKSNLYNFWLLYYFSLWWVTRSHLFKIRIRYIDKKYCRLMRNVLLIKIEGRNTRFVLFSHK